MHGLGNSRMFWPLALPVAIVLAAGLVRLQQPGPDQLQQIHERDALVVLTRSGASSYFVDTDGESGPEFLLARAFADHLGVDLEVRAVEEYGQLASLLEAGEGDFIAANLSRTPSRERRLRFGSDITETRIAVVTRKSRRQPDDVTDLVGMKLAVVAGTSYEERLQLLAQSVPGLEWTAHADAGIEDLLQAIQDGDIDATLVDASILAHSQDFYPRLAPAFLLEGSESHAWAFRAGDDDSLMQAAEVFLAQVRTDGRLAAILDRFENERSPVDQLVMHRFMERARERLPQFLPMFREVAQAHGLDWRLLAALAYQESHWDPLAASHTGVRGLMMLTHSTATAMGLDDRLDPGQSIEGGARYLARMLRRIPARIPEPDRTWMALAAYNIGLGHLEDARVLTQRQGGNPDSWADVRARLPLLTQEQYYRDLKHGYARGFEAQRHVRNIRSFYDILVWMDAREHPILVASL